MSQLLFRFKVFAHIHAPDSFWYRVVRGDGYVETRVTSARLVDRRKRLMKRVCKLEAGLSMSWKTTCVALAVMLWSNVNAHAQDDPKYGTWSLTTQAYKDCMDQAGGIEVEMMDCNSAEYERQDNELNRTYQRVLATLPPDQKIQLRDDERAWLKRIDKLCNSDDPAEGRDVARENAIGCNISERESRILYLRRFGR